MSSTTPLQPGSIVSTYTLTRFLGRGAMGEVWEALHRDTGESYALKFLLEEAMTGENAVKRFQREAEIMAALDHPHIAKVFEWGETDGRHWLCIELLGDLIMDEGEAPVTTLEDYISSKGGKLPQEEVQICMGQFLDALAYAHGKGLVHRDLKPANILLCEEGMKIADFGLVDAERSEWMGTKAQATVAATVAQGGEAHLNRTIRESASSEQTHNQALLGTFAYMSPEQKKGWPATELSDLYAAGLVCFHMLTGEIALGLEMPSEMDGTLWKGWDAFIRKSLRTKPEERYSDATEMSATLENVEHAPPLQNEQQTSQGQQTSGFDSQNSSTPHSGFGPEGETESWEIPPASEDRPRRLAIPPFKLVWLLGFVVVLGLGYGVFQWWGVYKEKLDDDRELVEQPTEMNLPSGQQLAASQAGLEEQAAELNARKREAEQVLREADEAAALMEEQRLAVEEAARRAKEAEEKLAAQEIAAHEAQIRAMEEAEKNKRLADLAAHNIAVAEARQQAAEIEMAALRKAANTPPDSFAIEGLGIRMIQVKPGTFQMGSPSSELPRNKNEALRSVTLTKAYWLGKYEVTQKQWKALMGNNPSQFALDDQPVEQVSWKECMDFCNRLNGQQGDKLPKGYKYNLPTEAQWEYACRAGSRGAYSFGASLSRLNANFGNYVRQTKAVGSYPSNSWGFHDMHGNVGEWCLDYYGLFHGAGAADPTGPSVGSTRVRRGGSWRNLSGDCRSASRNWAWPDDRNTSLGFRLALSPITK